MTNETAGGTEVFTVVLRGRIFGQGGGANPTTDILAHVTLVDGQPTAVVDVFEVTCQPPLL